MDIMSNAHIAFYRKYRPQHFKDVAGQDHIVRVLESSITLGRISHAYLFYGSRGTGKTSVARIFARALGTTSDDLYEIDAASNTGVDDVRALNESVATLPFSSKYKVYIIDEVHMLSKAAFNALLKTLEEPPAHVVFVLATTEMEKLPETVVSRCQTFAFKKPSVPLLSEFLQKVSKKEGVTLDKASAELIALLAEGSFRDAHGLLEKVAITAKNGKIDIEVIEAIAGAPRNELVNTYLEAFSEKDATKGLGAIHEAVKANADMKFFLRLSLYKLRAILLYKYAPDLRPTLMEELGAHDAAFVARMSEKKIIDSQVLLALLNADEYMEVSSVAGLPLELALIGFMEHRDAHPGTPVSKQYRPLRQAAG